MLRLKLIDEAYNKPNGDWRIIKAEAVTVVCNQLCTDLAASLETHKPGYPSYTEQVVATYHTLANGEGWWITKDGHRFTTLEIVEVKDAEGVSTPDPESARL